MSSRASRALVRRREINAERFVFLKLFAGRYTRNFKGVIDPVTLGGNMRLEKLGLGAVALLIALAACGCGHRLVASQGDKAVKVYDSEGIYESARNLRKQLEEPKLGQLEALRPQMSWLLSMAETREARDIDDGTRVKIIARSAAGAQIEVLEGAKKGYRGFVPKENLR